MKQQCCRLSASITLYLSQLVKYQQFKLLTLQKCVERTTSIAAITTLACASLICLKATVVCLVQKF